eukprot:jgi/Mesvir1/18473/Mv14323-RA.1
MRAIFCVGSLACRGSALFGDLPFATATGLHHSVLSDLADGRRTDQGGRPNVNQPVRPLTVKSIHCKNVIRVKGKLKDVYKYAADFSHIADWDPGTSESKRDPGSKAKSTNSLAVGTTFSLMSILSLPLVGEAVDPYGHPLLTKYMLTEVEPRRRVVYLGESVAHHSRDEMVFRPLEDKDGPKTEITYITDIDLKEYRRWAAFLFDPLNWWFAWAAIKGLEKKLNAMAEERQRARAARRPAGTRGGS